MDQVPPGSIGRDIITAKERDTEMGYWRLLRPWKVRHDMYFVNEDGADRREIVWVEPTLCEHSNKPSRPTYSRAYNVYYVMLNWEL